jgi:SAM-dependent methyltransferase
MEHALVEEARLIRGPVVDIACGVGSLTARLSWPERLAYGLDPSAEMLGVGALLDPRRRRFMTRAIAESLPFRPSSAGCIVCEGALDHFVSPQVFFEEAANTLIPGGKLVIALANYDSLSCRIGRTTGSVSHSGGGQRPYWQPPPDHYHRGNASFIRSLGASDLAPRALYGVSMLWLAPGWGPLLDRLPAPVARALLHCLDRIAHRCPALADVIVATWEKPAHD